jgi:predicted esterase
MNDRQFLLIEGETEESSTRDGNKKRKGGEEDSDHEHLEEDADWDDAVFLQKMLDSLIDGFPSSIDRNSVFAIGISNGGFFLCDALGPSRMATLFSGVCFMVSGCSMTTPTEARLDMANSKVPSIPVLLIIGSLDSHHYRFGRRAEEVFKSAGFEDTTLIQVRRGHEYYPDLERVIMRFFRSTNIQDVLPTIRDLEDPANTPTSHAKKKQ